MPLRKIAEIDRVPGHCGDPEHYPAIHHILTDTPHSAYPDGFAGVEVPACYEHECPSCHKMYRFAIHGIYDTGVKRLILWEDVPPQLFKCKRCGTEHSYVHGIDPVLVHE